MPDPACADDEVIIEVDRAGLCGTDLHIYRDEYMSDFPIVPGHEFCGRIVEVGRGVKDLKADERVAADPNLDCGSCAFCRRQQNNHCTNWQGVGITRPGAFAQYVAVPSRAVYRLRPEITDAQAAFIEPLSCVVHAMSRLAVDPGETALLFGAGPMGLLLTQVLRRRGVARLVVVDTRPARLELAATLGATHTLVASSDLQQDLADMTPLGFDIVVDATGVRTVIAQAFDHLGPRGRYLQFGVAPRDATVPLSPYQMFRGDWTLLGSFALCYSFEQAIALLAEGVVDVDPLISHTLPLSEFPSAFDDFVAGRTLKVHFEPG